MHGRLPRRRSARPVADAPIDELLARTDDLAKGWLLALLEETPLEDASRVLASGLAEDGPRLCGAVLRALSDDVDLDRLGPGGVLEPLAASCGGFGGQAGGEAALRAVDALHGVLWGALRAELRDPHPDLVADLTARLTATIELVRAAAIRRAAQPAAGAVPGGAPEARLRPVPGRAGGDEQASAPAMAAPSPGTPDPGAGSPGPEAGLSGSEAGPFGSGAGSSGSAAAAAGSAVGREAALWVHALGDEV